MFKGRKFNAITMIRAFRSRIQSLKKTLKAPDVKDMLKKLGANKKRAKKTRIPAACSARVPFASADLVSSL